MAEKKRRIHHLAKDLEVKSKTIIEKCAAEGIEIKNHMHVVSAGLEATIREWFSEGAHVTTLEESERIDLKRVRVKTKKKKKTAASEALAGTSGPGEAATAILEPPPDTGEAAEPVPPGAETPDSAAAAAATASPAEPVGVAGDITPEEVPPPTEPTPDAAIQAPADQPAEEKEEES
ncbi:MAG: translation initiation factor IF-2 N-terminal domain-containing protein, partial [Phycisphaerae bacterium]